MLEHPPAVTNRRVLMPRHPDVSVTRFTRPVVTKRFNVDWWSLMSASFPESDTSKLNSLAWAPVEIPGEHGSGTWTHVRVFAPATNLKLYPGLKKPCCRIRQVAT